MNFIRRLNRGIFFIYQARVLKFGSLFRGIEVCCNCKMSAQYLQIIPVVPKDT